MRGANLLRLSLATDLGMGQPLEFALRSCVLAVRLGDALASAGRGRDAAHAYLEAGGGPDDGAIRAATFLTSCSCAGLR